MNEERGALAASTLRRMFRGAGCGVAVKAGYPGAAAASDRGTPTPRVFSLPASTGAGRGGHPACKLHLKYEEDPARNKNSLSSLRHAMCATVY